MKCQKCHSTENLCKNSVTSKGTVQYICRDCVRERLSKYRQTRAGKEAAQKAVNKQYKLNPQKQIARIKVYQALKKGVLEKPKNCQDCLKLAPLQGHHHDYGKPLEVYWVCTGCHAKIHRGHSVLK